MRTKSQPSSLLPLVFVSLILCMGSHCGGDELISPGASTLGDCGLSLGPGEEVERRIELRISEAGREELRALGADERASLEIGVWYGGSLIQGGCTREGGSSEIVVRLHSEGDEVETSGLNPDEPILRGGQTSLTIPIFESCEATGSCIEERRLVFQNPSAGERTRIAWHAALTLDALFSPGEQPRLSAGDISVRVVP